MPKVTLKKAALLILDLIKLLKEHKLYHPIAKYNDETLVALDNLQSINAAPTANKELSKLIVKHNNTKLPRVQPNPANPTLKSTN